MQGLVWVYQYYQIVGVEGQLGQFGGGEMGYCLLEMYGVVLVVVYLQVLGVYVQGLVVVQLELGVEGLGFQDQQWEQYVVQYYWVGVGDVVDVLYWQVGVVIEKYEQVGVDELKGDYQEVVVNQGYKVFE